MPENEYLAVLRALADSTRLRMLRTLGSCPSSAEDLATLLGLAPSTVSFHLKKLEQAGLVSGKREQYYRIFSRDEQALTPRLDIVDREPAEADRGGQDRPMANGCFGQYMRRGRLVKLRGSKPLVILEAIAESFSDTRPYTEQEVNTILGDQRGSLYPAPGPGRRRILLRARDIWRKTRPGPAKPGSPSKLWGQHAHAAPTLRAP